MLTMVWNTWDENFDVMLGERWIGKVWVDSRSSQWWVAQDFDGDTEHGWSTFLSAGDWVRSMSGGMTW